MSSRMKPTFAHVEVQKSGALSRLWLSDQHGATIIHIEPRAP